MNVTMDFKKKEQITAFVNHKFTSSWENCVKYVTFKGLDFIFTNE